MRTTLDIKDSLIKELMVYYDAKTKTEAVNNALLNWINYLKKQKLLSLRGKIDIVDNLEDLKRKELKRLKHE
jgi:hypothetical protein